MPAGSGRQYPVGLPAAQSWSQGLPHGLPHRTTWPWCGGAGLQGQIIWAEMLGAHTRGKSNLERSLCAQQA